MERLTSAVLEKVNADARAIVKEAEDMAASRIKAAREQQRARFEEQKMKLVSEASIEASRILAQAAIKARQETLAAKTAVVSEIIEGVKKRLVGLSENEKILQSLTREGIRLLGTDKVRVSVSARDLSAMQKVVKEDSDLAATVTEIKRRDSLGGVIVSDATGKNQIDNTFETRLEMLLPRLLPEIARELFPG